LWVLQFKYFVHRTQFTNLRPKDKQALLNDSFDES
jgi:hypothetical protein